MLLDDWAFILGKNHQVLGIVLVLDIRPVAIVRVFFKHLALNVGPSWWAMIIYSALAGLVLFGLYFFPSVDLHFLYPSISFMQIAYSFAPIRVPQIACAPVAPAAAVRCLPFEISVPLQLLSSSVLSSFQLGLNVRSVAFDLGLLPPRFLVSPFSLARIRLGFGVADAKVKSILEPLVLEKERPKN